MLTSVKYITKNLNNLIWELDDSKGLCFEDYIYSTIKKQLQKYYREGLRIIKTTNTRDDGIDIYITSPVAFSIMGVDFSLKGKKTISLVIECKSTSHKKISLERFAKNIIVNKELPLDYFILVTNGTIVPYSYFKAQEELQQQGCEFCLFDQYFLLNYLKETEDEIPGDTSGFVFEENPIHIEYQVRKGKIDGRNYFDLFLVIKNYTPQIVEVSLTILSNRNWDVQDNVGISSILPYHSKCIKLIVKRIYNDGIDDFKLNVFFNNESHELIVKNPEVLYDFQPPLTGEQHKEVISDLKEKLFHLSSAEFVYLYGEAGIGKTRIIDEITKDIIDTDYKILHFLCTGQHKESLKMLFYNKLKIENPLSKTSWKMLYRYLKEDQFSRYLIIIEDLHNASDDYLIELKEFIQNLPTEIPCCTIMAGREDDTVYNESFFSFSTWLKEKKELSSEEIVKLKNDECKHFIQSIVQDIPASVLEKVLKLSNKNPFYIVQFIEYLLEVQLVSLINRNTVGITNINTFSAQVYIPKKIEQLIKLREKNLLSQKYGKQYIDFLYLMSLYGINSSKEIIDEFWGGESSDKLEPLFKKRYISYDKNDTIKFDHETLYLYFRKQAFLKNNMERICKFIVKDCNSLLLYFDNFQKAQIYFYAKELKKAEELFKPIIEEVSTIQNISSINLLPEYYNYLNDIYELFQKKKRKEMYTDISEKILYSSVYIPMHNYDYGTTTRAIKEALDRINRSHANNEKLRNTILQLQAHTELTAANLAKAEHLFLDLLADERLHPEDFTPQSRFDLFDRTASLYTRYNYKSLAQKYNELATKVAYKYADPKLISLSLMMKAKINYYNNTEQSVKYMVEAQNIMVQNKAYRINCHNNVSMLGADLLLKYKKEIELTNYIREAKRLLEEAVDKNYSFTIIRCNLLLATLYYLLNDTVSLISAEKYVNDGINSSIHYGCEKLMNYFYNLKAIIALSKGMSLEEVMSYFNTMIYYLRKQNLLFLGNLDFCYGNIISLTNYAKFIYYHGSEQMLYNFLGKLDYYYSDSNCDFDCSKEKQCYYTCKKNIDFFKKSVDNIEKKQLILLDESNHYPLLDPKTGYFVVIH